jgi:diacylglycerol kinase (ATP)
MKRSRRRHPVRTARQIAQASSRLAQLVADAEREEDERAAAIAENQARAALFTSANGRATAAALADEESAAPPAAAPESVAPPVVGPWTRAILIINTKSGPSNDSILRVREVVERLAAHGITAEVRVKLRKKQARREARAAAKAGYPLIIAAGGDGTVAAVAAGLVGAKAVLGIIPLGTYNNVATSLGIPTDIAQAIALIAVGATRPVDVGWVQAQGRRKGRVFLEMAAVGVTAALMPVGQNAKKGAWDQAARHLPAAVQMEPTPTRIRLDGAKPVRRVKTLLVEVVNAPRMGPGLQVSPDSRMDDGLLDVALYENVGQAALATRFVALKAGTATSEDRIERIRARRVSVRTETPMPVVADSKVIGTTPASFKVIPGGLLVAAGHGDALAHPVAAALVDAAAGEGPASMGASTDADDTREIASAPALVEDGAHQPLMARLARGARALVVPVAALGAFGAAGVAGVLGSGTRPLHRLLSRRAGP